MTRYIAFLRAINVGGHTVKMEHLRSLFEALKFSKVETFIASGNVIFEADQAIETLEARIEQHLQQALGYEVKTFIRTAEELAQVAAYRPFPAAELEDAGNFLYVGFLKEHPGEQAKQTLMLFESEVDSFLIHRREVYWLCRKKISESTFSGAKLEKALGMASTMRNSTTVNKLAAKYPSI